MNEKMKKDEYQKPNVDGLMCLLAKTITINGISKIWFLPVHLKHVFGHVRLNPELAKHCIFAIISGKANGICRFLTGFYGLAVMPTEFKNGQNCFNIL